VFKNVPQSSPGYLDCRLPSLGDGSHLSTKLMKKLVIMFSKPPTLQFPLWKFLKQPVFQSDYATVLNPRRFWHLHTIDLLERCLITEFTSRDSRRD
jgi:hypothetical protein